MTEEKFCIGKFNKTHGLSQTKIYYAWKHMRERCLSKRTHSYQGYGSRGIQICEEWKDNPVAFYEWAILSGYKEGYSIERIDVNGNYCPENCTWIPFNQQASNRRTTKILTAWGESKTLSEWIRDSRCIVKRSTLTNRIKEGWQLEDALTKPLSRKGSTKLNIVIPMSGLGSRFTIAGYKVPKPLIPLFDSTMIEKVIDNIYVDNAKFIFIVQKEHCTLFDIDKLLIEKCIKLKCNYEIISINGQTRGAADTILKARDYIDNKSRLIVCNSDQIMEDYSTFSLLQYADTKLADGVIAVFHRENDKRWSYVEIKDLGTISRIVEKEQISNFATTGLYYYRYGSDCIKYILEMIDNDDKVNGEYYFAPSMNYAIKDKKRIIPFQIEKMVPLGTPEDYERYINGR